MYPLRPELIESIFHLFAVTGDPAYLRWGERILTDLETRCRTTKGVASLNNVRRASFQDRMPSFFLAETSKYLMLLFDGNSTFDARANNNLLFTTEGHFAEVSQAIFDSLGPSPSFKTPRGSAPLSDRARTSADRLDSVFPKPRTCALVARVRWSASSIGQRAPHIPVTQTPSRHLLRAGRYPAFGDLHVDGHGHGTASIKIERIMSQFSLFRSHFEDVRVHTSAAALGVDINSVSYRWHNDVVHLPLEAGGKSKNLLWIRLSTPGDVPVLFPVAKGAVGGQGDVHTWDRLVQNGPELRVVLAQSVYSCTDPWISNHPPISYQGAAVLVLRGVCPFAEKLSRLQAAGAALALVADMEFPHENVVMGGDLSLRVPSIPSLFLGTSYASWLIREILDRTSATFPTLAVVQHLIEVPCYDAPVVAGGRLFVGGTSMNMSIRTISQLELLLAAHQGTFEVAVRDVGLVDI